MAAPFLLSAGNDSMRSQKSEDGYCTVPVYHHRYIITGISSPVYHHRYIITGISSPVYHHRYIMTQALTSKKGAKWMKGERASKVLHYLYKEVDSSDDEADLSFIPPLNW
jgi:hypothetical protein